MDEINFLKILNNPLLWNKEFVTKYNNYITKVMARKIGYKEDIITKSKNINDMWGFKVPAYITVMRYNKFMSDMRILGELKEIFEIDDYRELIVEINRYNLNPTTKIDKIQKKINKLSLDFVTSAIQNKEIVLKRIEHYDLVLKYILDYDYNFTDMIINFIYDKPKFKSKISKTNKVIILELGIIFNDVVFEFIDDYRKGQKYEI